MLYFMPSLNDIRDMPYFVPDRFSPALSEGGGGIYFSISPRITEDLPLRVLCGRACLLMQQGCTVDQVRVSLDIENYRFFEESFKTYTGMRPEEYMRWLKERGARCKAALKRP